jgi:uncharacterized protein YdhG (YjbR/CyaY superfamily)
VGGQAEIVTKTRPTTVSEYLAAAPIEAQPHLKRLRELLQAVAPKATETLKWGNPFFVEPRFVFAYSAHKAHLSFAPGTGVMAEFNQAFGIYQSTKHFLKIRYDQPLPEALIRRMAKRSLQVVMAREDEGFW